MLRFKESTSVITYQLLKNALLGEATVNDPTLHRMVSDYAADAFKKGPQIGDAYLLEVGDDAIASLESIDRAIDTISPQGSATLKTQEQTFRAQHAALLTELENIQAVSDKEKKDILERARKAPNPKEFIKQFPKPLAVIEQRSEDYSKKVIAFLKAVEDAKASNLIKYKKLFNNADEGIKKGMKDPMALEEMTRSRPMSVRKMQP